MLPVTSREIQIDIVDGVFVPDRSWPYIDASDGVTDFEKDIESSIASLGDTLPTEVSYELDLMIAEPLQTLPLWLAQHPKGVVLHIESFAADADIMRAIEMVRSASVRVVLAAQNDTPLARVLAFVPYIDGIQCMGIAQIGKQGNPFDMRVLDRIRTIREKHPELSISVDGSVNKETIVLLKTAGVNRFVVGSAIFDAPDPAHAYAELAALTKT
jgi:ribulose-phosphate 3-epimerase